MAIYVPKIKSFKALRCTVTVEPMLFLYFFTYVVSTYVGSNMLLHKGCDPNATTAPNLKIAPQCLLETAAQQGVASINVGKHIIQELLSLVLIMYVGPWSDNHGRRRRPLMFVPVFGQILCDMLNVFFSLYWQVSPTVTGIMQSVIMSTTGSFHCFLIGMFAYISDVTDETNRTMRIGFASAILPLAATIGALCSGYLNVKLGFVNLFVMNICINVFAIFLGFLFIYDVSEPQVLSGSLYKSTFNPNIILKSFKTVFIKRNNGKRTILLLMLLASPLTSAPFIGEISLLYLYLRKQFNFKEIDFSIFNAYTTGIMLLGSMFTLGILSRVLKINDSLIGLIATFFDIATAVGFLLVVKLQYLYFIPPFEIFRGAALSIVGSIASKCVEPHELGSMNSVRVIIENISKSAILPLYNIVYHRTLETMPNAFYIISLCLTVPLIGCFAMSYYLTRNNVAKNSNQKNNLKVASCLFNKNSINASESHIYI